jgi:hypothetical protein
MMWRILKRLPPGKATASFPSANEGTLGRDGIGGGAFAPAG